MISHGGTALSCERGRGRVTAMIQSRGDLYSCDWDTIEDTGTRHEYDDDDDDDAIVLTRRLYKLGVIETNKKVLRFICI